MTSIRQIRHAVAVSLGVMVLAILPAAPATAKPPCEDLATRKERTTCFQKRADRLRRGTRAMRPSELTPQLAFLDARNPLGRDRYYVGLPESPTGLRSIDRLARSVAEVEAMVSLVQLSAQLEKRQQSEQAGRILTELVPVMKEVEPRLNTLVEQVTALPEEVGAAVSDQPLHALKLSKAAMRLVPRGKRIHADFPAALRNGKALLNSVASSSLAD